VVAWATPPATPRPATLTTPPCRRHSDCMPPVTPLSWAGHRPDPAIRSHDRRLVITFCDQSASTFARSPADLRAQQRMAL